MEVDLEYVFGVAVTVTKATSVVTWEQSVKHVEKKATWQESVDPHIPHKHQQSLSNPQTLVQLRTSPQLEPAPIG